MSVENYNVSSASNINPILMKMKKTQQTISAEQNQIISFLHKMKENNIEDCTIVFVKTSTPKTEKDIETSVLEESLLESIIKNVDLSSYILIDYMNGIFNQDEEFISNINLNFISKCPIYVILASDINQIENFYSLENKNWDKFFTSRKQIIITNSNINDIDNFIKSSEIINYSNLIMVTKILETNNLRILTNKPYDQTSQMSIKSLMKWNGLDNNFVDNLFGDKLSDFHGYLMRVLTFHFPPRIFMEEKEDGTYEMGGVDIEVRALHIHVLS